MPTSSPNRKSKQASFAADTSSPKAFSPSKPRGRHANIALDPISHLVCVDHIVDDISNEIMHRQRHSPTKNLRAEANNVELMEGFGR